MNLQPRLNHVSTTHQPPINHSPTAPQPRLNCALTAPQPRGKYTRQYGFGFSHPQIWTLLPHLTGRWRYFEKESISRLIYVTELLKDLIQKREARLSESLGLLPSEMTSLRRELDARDSVFDVTCELKHKRSCGHHIIIVFLYTDEAFDKV